MGCEDCNDYTPQQLRVNYVPDNGVIFGIVQAEDNSFGVATSGVVTNGHIYFSRPRASGKNYIYDIDLYTFDGIDTVNGTRANLNYGYTQEIKFSLSNTKQVSMKLVQCPEK